MDEVLEKTKAIFHELKIRKEKLEELKKTVQLKNV
jgi:hypothetical protein